MLILTRRVGESLIIGDDIEIVVLGTKGNQTRLGINAPADVSVHRQEIYEKINGTSSVSTETDDDDFVDEIDDQDNIGNR